MIPLFSPASVEAQTAHTTEKKAIRQQVIHELLAFQGRKMPVCKTHAHMKKDQDAGTKPRPFLV